MSNDRGAAQALTASQARQVQDAFRLLEQGAAAQALELAQRILMERPQSPDAHHLVALCHARQGHTELAEQAFRDALALAPDQPMILVNLGAMLREHGRPAEAMPAYQTAADRAPGFAKAWIGLGRCALDTNEHQQACDAFQQALALQPDSATRWQMLGKALRAAERLDEAETALRKALSLQPDLAAAWLDLGVVHRLQGRADLSLPCYRKAREHGIDDPIVTDAEVGVLLDQGHTSQAIDLARQLVQAHPDFVAGHITLAHLLWEYGSDIAPGVGPLDAFTHAVAASPRNQPLRLALARFLLEARQAEQALEHIAILRTAEDGVHLRMLEANALEIAGRSIEAGKCYRQIHQAGHGNHPAFLCAWVRHLLNSGEWQEAEQHAAHAVRLDARHQEAWAYLATAWRLLDDPREHWLCDYDRLIALIDVGAPADYDDSAAFLADLQNALEPMHQARREPVQQSLRGGSQTPGRLFGRPEPRIAQAEQILRQAAERWLETLPADEKHPFLARNTRHIRFTGSWSVKLWSSGNHVNHIHSQGWMSSAFYVALPPSVRAQQDPDDRAGFIQFGQPPVELGLNLPPRRIIRPEPGHLALFPSYMWHGTVPFEDTQPRMTMAFDMVPTGQPMSR